MKLTITTKPKHPRSINLGVIIIFIIVTLLFIISFAQSDFMDDLFNRDDLVKSEGSNSIN